MRKIRADMPFETVACVLLFDHFHAIWTLPHGDDNFSDRWREIKGEFTQSWLAAGGREQPVTRSQAARGHRGVWHKRFWEHMVRDEEELSNLCDYIHYNPVKHRLAERPGDWSCSTFHRFVERGHYPEDWGRNEPPNIQGMDFE